MKRKLKKISFKTFAVILSVLMALMSLPLTAFAVPEEAQKDIAAEKTPKDVFEVVDRREENVKHFRLEDGSYTCCTVRSAGSLP